MVVGGGGSTLTGSLTVNICFTTPLVRFEKVLEDMRTVMRTMTLMTTDSTFQAAPQFEGDDVDDNAVFSDDRDSGCGEDDITFQAASQCDVVR